MIIDDARFPNEIYYPRALFGDKVVSFRVQRLDDNGNNFNSSLTDKQKKHPSEIALDDFNFDYTSYASNISEVEKNIDDLMKLL